jgi:DNA-binding LacI/PurR family transcriptional regulator
MKQGHGQQESVKNLAARLGISKTALYLYIRDPETSRLGAETKRRIEETLGETRLLLNVNARNLSIGRSRAIAVLVPLDIPYFRNIMVSELLSGLQSVMFRRNYRLVFVPPAMGSAESGSIGMLRDQAASVYGYDGCILFGTRACSATDMRENVEQMRKTTLPFVVLNMPAMDADINQVVAVTPRAASGTRFLLSMGHKRVLFMGGAAAAPDTEIELSEYRSLHGEFGLDYDEGLVRNGGYERATARSELLRALDEGRTFSAVFCLSDTMALGVYEAADDRRLGIPGDISVVGRDDAIFATAMRPRLTTVRIPAYETGKAAAELLLGSIEGGSPSRRLELQNELILRESVRVHES